MMAHAHEIIERHLHDAADGNRHALDQLLEALQPQVHLMVAARLAATPAQFHAVEEIAQVSMIALVSALVLGSIFAVRSSDGLVRILALGLGARTLRSDTAVIALVSIVHEALRAD